MASKLVVLCCLLVLSNAARLTSFRKEYPSRIIGGRDALPGEFPHQVSVQWGAPPIVSFIHLCGGTIIAKDWILTAAHCTRNVRAFGNLIIRAGKIDIGMIEKFEQMIEVDDFYVHEKFPENSGPYDIALLKLKTPLKFNDYVAPIDLPKRDMVLTEGTTRVCGWGSISTTVFPKFPNILQTVDLPIINLKVCNDSLVSLEQKFILHDTNMCTGPLTGSFATCGGDSGGSLILNNNGTKEIIGIISWGMTPCGMPYTPSIFTRVSAFVDWIEETKSKHS